MAPGTASWVARAIWFQSVTTSARVAGVVPVAARLAQSARIILAPVCLMVALVFMAFLAFVFFWTAVVESACSNPTNGRKSGIFKQFVSFQSSVIGRV